MHIFRNSQNPLLKLSTHWSKLSPVFLPFAAETSIGCLDLDICEKTLWSSKSEDPKSEIHGVDLKTGYLR
jgi:hypothetical protein